MTNTNPDQAITTSRFLDIALKSVERQVPQNLQPYRVRRHAHLAKIAYDRDRVHFELWVDRRRDAIDLGLHFEEGPASTAAFLAFFDIRIVEIKHALGPEVELARWTPGWGHIYDLLPMAPFNREKAEFAGARLAQLITVLQPLVIEADVPVLDRPSASYGARRGRRS